MVLVLQSEASTRKAMVGSGCVVSHRAGANASLTFCLRNLGIFITAIDFLRLVTASDLIVRRFAAALDAFGTGWRIISFEGCAQAKTTYHQVRQGVDLRPAYRQSPVQEHRTAEGAATPRAARAHASAFSTANKKTNKQTCGGDPVPPFGRS